MKKLLLITYYWPPAGGPGVQRWLGFVKHLPEFGIEPVVYVPENPSYPIQDKSLISEIPDKTTVLKHPIFEPYKLASLLSKKDTQTISSGLIEEEKKQTLVQKTLLWLRGNFFVPDARKFWVKPSTKFLAKYLSEEKIDTVVTTGPPHSLHLIGLGLKQKMNINWIADFRDPWTSIGYHEKLKLSTWAKKKHKRLEKNVLDKADQILTTSFATQKEFEKITQQPISVITNGYDSPSEAAAREQPFLDEQFTLSHIGSLLSKRNPENLWKALGELIEENEQFKQHFKLRLVGKTSQNVLDSLKFFKLADFVDFMGYVSHKNAVRLQQQSQVLLLLEIDSEETKAIIPGKLFEYLHSRRPVLAIGPKGWDVEKIMQETEAGACFNYGEKKEIKAKILDYFENYQQGKLQSNPKKIEKYSRKKITQKLSEVIKK